MLSDATPRLRIDNTFKGLNPCSNGICSLTSAEDVELIKDNLGLNPCSNGICSLTDESENSYAPRWKS